MEKHGFLAYKEGNKKYKTLLSNNTTIPIRKFLQSQGFEMPQILAFVVKEKTITIESEWINGRDFFDLQKEKELTSEDFHKWGIFMAKMHDIKNDKGLSVASRDLQFGNVIRCDDGRVMLCDYAKLYYTDFPEEEIIRHILSTYVSKKGYKDSFMKGYLTQRGITLDKIIQKALHVNWDNYHDLYCNGVLLRKGPRSNKRLNFLPKDMEGLRVADLGCSCGMLARESKRRGAKYVLAIDKQHHSTHRLIDLVSLVAYAENLEIDCKAIDVADGSCIKNTVFDIIFFCAVMGHLNCDRFEYLKMLRTKCKIIFFETNLGGKEAPHRQLLEKAGFTDIKCLGESGDPDRESNSHYTMFKCKGDL